MWAQNIQGNALSEPQVANGTVYFSAERISNAPFAGIVALNAATGAVRWTKPDISSQDLTGFVLVDGILYIPDGLTYALKASDGSVVWNKAISEGAMSVVVIP
ncbi:MAG TPA: PQQ-binding-like beta-propeller repeat protein [Ktedonobacteraceae bacterium]|nr:PQQ-binding-like beta-propeller repeat protein [Ktedonobacteraceae bacterium]